MKRRPVDSWFWELYERACGARCCACGKSGVKLERGHIIPHAPGGTDGLENLVPVCPPCNKKYLRKPTPTNYRPANYLEQFYLLLGGVLRPQIIVRHVNGSCNLIPASEGTENSTVVEWPNPDFGACTEVFTYSSRTLSPAEAAKVVTKLFERTKEFARERGLPLPRRPVEKRRTRMLALAAVGAEAFLIAGDAHMREKPCPWVLGSEDREYATADCWQHFVDSFDDYLAEGRVLLVRRAAEEKVQREKAAVERERHRIAVRERMWADYLLPLTVPAWEGQSAVDAEHSAAVTARKEASAGEVPDVSDAELKASYAVLCHYKNHKTEELLAAKDPLREMLRKSRVWLGDFDADGRKYWLTLINPAEEWLDKVNDSQELKDEAWTIQQNIYNELDPSRREAEEASRVAREKEILDKFSAEPPPGYDAANESTRIDMWLAYREENIFYIQWGSF
jgi:hypothetical protein